MIEVRNVSKVFILPIEKKPQQIRSITVLSDLTFALTTGSWTSLTGASGSGKSTLLSLLSGLDVPSSGELLIDGQNLAQLTEDDRAHYRAQHMGFVFQNFRLLPHLTALENVQVPLEILGDENAETRSREILARVGLEHRLENLPGQLSGGEQQRVAIARAFVTRPKILFADEPTGNLDSKHGESVLALMKELHAEFRSTLVVVTHDPTVAAFGEKQLKLKDGQLA